jgi:hypothetical protein
MDCSKCGKEYDNSFKFCPACGKSNPQVAEQPTASMEQPVPASGLTQPPLPADDQQPPVQKSKSRGKRIAIAVVSVAIVLILSLCVVLGTVLLKGYEAKAKNEANQFIQNALKKDYESQYKQISPSSYNIMWLSGVCSAKSAGLSQTGLPPTGISIEQAYASKTGLLSGMFGGEPVKSSIQDGKLSSAKVTSISNQTFYVELNYKGASEPFPLIVNRQNNTYSIDFAATLVLNDPTIAKKTRQTVESLLQNPTVKNCDTAQAILVEAQTLKSELGLWLKNGPKNTLGDTKTTEINDAIKETEGFVELSAKVEKVKEELPGKKPEPKTSTTKESTPTTTTATKAPSTPSSTPKEKQKPPPKTTAAKHSPEYMCASIQKGYEVKADDPLVASFALVFDALQSEYPNDTRESFADVVVTAKQQLDSKSTVNQTLLEVAQGIYGSTTPEIVKSVSLQEIAAAYVTIIINLNGQ